MNLLTLITRPAPFAQMLQASLERLHIPSKVSSLMTVSYCPEKVPLLTEEDAVLTTSQQAILVLAKALRTQEVQASQILLGCVGEESLTLAKRLGFSRSFCPPSVLFLSDKTRSEHLLNYFSHSFKGIQKVFYLSGDRVKFDLETAAKQVEFTSQVTRVVVYETHALHALEPSVEDALRTEKIGSVLFHSSRLIHIWRAVVQKTGLEDQGNSLTAICFSPSLAAEAQNLGFSKTLFSDTMTEGGIIHCVRQYLLKERRDG